QAEKKAVMAFWSAARPPLSFLWAGRKESGGRATLQNQKRKRRPRRTPKQILPLGSPTRKMASLLRTTVKDAMTPDNADRLRLRLIDQLLHLPPVHLGEVEALLGQLTTGNLPAAPVRPPAERDWPHAPLHRISEQGTYIVTSGTCEKAHHFRGPERL